MTLGKRTDYGDAKYAGLEVALPQDVDTAVQDTLLCGFDFIVTPLVQPGHRPPPPSAETGVLPLPFGRDDVLYLPSSQWVRQVVGRVSSWVDPDSPDPVVARDSSAALRAELGWAAHLGLQAVLLPPPPRPRACAAYARALTQLLDGLTTMALWLTLPLVPPPDNHPAQPPSSQDQPAMSVDGGADEAGSSSSQAAVEGSGAYGSQEWDTWEAWHCVRTLADYDSLLGVALELGPVLPPGRLLSRWHGEPVKALIIPTSTFTTNKRGYPVLPKPHQEFVATMFSQGVQVVVTGGCLHPEAVQSGGPQPPLPADPTPAEAAAAAPGGNYVINNPGESHEMRPYWEYLAYLFRRLPVVPEEARLEGEYKDYLQAPLQPLQDNLESQTYEVFEKDVTKYVQYEEAVLRALRDRAARSLNGEASTSGQKPVVLMVVGAGRGPLVAASMRASLRSGVPLRVYAVEKNPNAVVHIQQMLRREGWGDRVTLVSADMRSWVAPEPADILVSELLGSFGDNELSPECLDGAQRFLAPGGISIPCSYTSFLAPVSTSKLWSDVRGYKDREHFETPYVVKFHRHHLLSTTQEMFTFRHPNNDKPIDNNRYKRVLFERHPHDGSAILHGLAGYFECELYGGVTLSTHPPTHTPNMSSWFPIYFPLREPVYVPAGAPVEVEMWRCCGAHKVWYEWSITAPVAIPIHNPGGRSYYVGL